MSELCPQSKPQQPREETAEIIARSGLTDKCILLAVRGYYRDSMGEPGKNDRAIYDDAIFFLTPTVYASFNANTDPSRYRAGNGFGSAKGMACLKAGLYRYKPGIHGLSQYEANGYKLNDAPIKPYKAFVQAGPVTVIRDGNPPYPETGFFGINIHCGSYTSTSSAGCQTIYRDQWKEFYSLVTSQLGFHDQGTVPYLLIERENA